MTISFQFLPNSLFTSPTISCCMVLRYWQHHKIIPEKTMCFDHLTCSNNILKIICYSYFHSVIGLLFLGRSGDSVKIFRLQKKIFGIMLGYRSQDSCRKLFVKLRILPLPSQYVFYLHLSVIKNKKQHMANSEVYYTDMRWHLKLTSTFTQFN
jgi:hypothetical protein